MQMRQHMEKQVNTLWCFHICPDANANADVASGLNHEPITVNVNDIQLTNNFMFNHKLREKKYPPFAYCIQGILACVCVDVINIINPVTHAQ